MDSKIIEFFSERLNGLNKDKEQVENEIKKIKDYSTYEYASYQKDYDKINKEINKINEEKKMVEEWFRKRDNANEKKKQLDKKIKDLEKRKEECIEAKKSEEKYIEKTAILKEYEDDLSKIESELKETKDIYEKTSNIFKEMDENINKYKKQHNIEQENVGPESIEPESIGPESIEPESIGPENAGPGNVRPKDIEVNLTGDGKIQYIGCKDGEKLNVVNVPVDDLNKKEYKKLLKKLAKKHNLDKDELKKVDPYLMSTVNDKIEKDIVLVIKGLKDTLDFKVEYDFKGMEELNFRKKMLLRKIARSAEKNGFEVKNVQKGILGRISNKIKSRVNAIKLLNSADTQKYLSEENPREDTADKIRTSRGDFRNYVSNLEQFDGYKVETEVPNGMKERIEKIKYYKDKEVEDLNKSVNEAKNKGTVIDVEEYEEEQR